MQRELKTTTAMRETTFKKLEPQLQEVIKKKAEECGKTLKEYLAHTGKNYCLLSGDESYAKPDASRVNYWVNGGIYDYVVYGSFNDAEEDCDYNDEVITETTAIKWLNEYALNHK